MLAPKPADPILADIIAKHGEFPDGPPEPEVADVTADEIAAGNPPAPIGVEAADAETLTAGEEAAPAAQPVEPPAAPAPDIAAIVAEAVARAMAAATPAPPPSQASAPPPAPSARTIDLDAFLADPAGVLASRQVPFEHVARSLVSADMRQRGQQPPVEWTAQTVVAPQIAVLQAQNAALMEAIGGIQSDRRRDAYATEISAAVDAAAEDKYPHLTRARAKDRGRVMARVNAEVSSRAKFADAKTPAPATADVLSAVETVLADAADLLGAPPVPPPVARKGPPAAMPSTFRGSPPPPTNLSTAELERRIRDEVIRKYPD